MQSGGKQTPMQRKKDAADYLRQGGIVMANNRTGQRRRTTNARGQRRSYNQVYIDGSAARKLEVLPELPGIEEGLPKKQLSHAARKNRDKAVYMNFGYVMFLAAALVVSGVILINYLQLQSDITVSLKKISTLESELNDLKMANDEEYTRIQSSVDLNEIRRIAITELGMTYPKEGQIVSVEDGAGDYVKQIAEIEN